MRSHPSEYEIVAPGSLQAVVSLLADRQAAWLPIAGGTDVMVQYAAGRLSARKLVSIWNLPELRRIEITAKEILVGAGCTYTDLRDNDIVRREFPLLHSAACWTGGIANQNRGTIGGNIVNASPAADSLPALLVYEAELILVSVRGERRVPYASFHTGYRKTLLATDELVQSVCLPRRFIAYFSYARKVGARNSQAISKVCIAAMGRLADGIVEDVHIALGSVAPVPLRLRQTEKTVKGKRIDSDLLLSAKNAAAAEIRAIDDIRSTARYRSAVAGNLVAEFLKRLNSASAKSGERKDFLARWNSLPIDQALRVILPCCGSKTWAQGMAGQKTFRGRSRAPGRRRRDLAQSRTIRLDGSIPKSSSNRRVASSHRYSCAVSKMVGAGTTQCSGSRGCCERRLGGCESGVRASLQSYLYRVRFREVCVGDSGNLSAPAQE